METVARQRWADFSRSNGFVRRNHGPECRGTRQLCHKEAFEVWTNVRLRLNAMLPTAKGLVARGDDRSGDGELKASCDSSLFLRRYYPQPLLSLKLRNLTRPLNPATLNTKLNHKAETKPNPDLNYYFFFCSSGSWRRRLSSPGWRSLV